ncbi:O-methylsterigmatocystin oxidoreductase [Colletotrichum scovillei]|uniref:O-methylsterigmatocystin oxidoreductase n=2 Tax=Colletotrichum scovillei TaxID=1209932 RepID=A0A9P7RDD9_9PEZI|nr:O-methylsterigmatocystin oxidoreductase [Colletotrichum scovillei]KAG7073876.1 O-methylsterigmatocystin oxidoreductase [Colletotrichum scovillei]KAG7081000.1 O-methylsterigmatocystin oxidoreductase [Colletotrichum scovillei]
MMLAAIIVSVLVYYFYSCRKRSCNLPPGPKPLPILGNVRDLPPSGIPEYKHWLKFKDIYGPISSIHILGQKIVLLHDRQAAHDLLTKSSTKTSGRPYMRFADICGFASLLNLQQYDGTFRRHRKLVHQQFGTKAVAARFRDSIEPESHRFLLRVLDDPANLAQHIKTEASAIILKITYGYSISHSGTDPLVHLIERTMDVFALATVLLAWAVDILPILQHLPEGLPATSFKKQGREWRRLLQTTQDVPYLFVQETMSKGTHEHSFVSSLLKEDGIVDGGTKHDYSEDDIKKTALVMYGGGADTTASALHSFILAMILFPDVQKKAQAEIDGVVGRDRLPEFGDRDRLPYTNGVVKEALRWLHVAPLGVAHRTDEDISYRGFDIPKGTYLLPSIWWFLHDPHTYSEPSSFDPARYSAPRNEPDPTDEAFGYGRRICPGRFLADESLFITIACLLATFDISMAVDDSGNGIAPQIATTSGLICRPVDFPYSITPRSEQSVHLIRSIQEKYSSEDEDADLVRDKFARLFE